MKRGFQKLFLFAIIYFLLFSSGLSEGKEKNILLITIDTLRLDRVSAYSEEYVKTPHIDELASKGILFTRAFAHNPLTLPSHVNILTGTTPLFHGIRDNAGYKLEDRFLTIAEYLKSKGYSTGAFVGAFPVDSRFGLDQGFDIYDDSYGTKSSLEFFYVERRAEDVISPALKWLEGQEGMWFAWIHLFDPHQPYLPPPEYAQKYPHDLYSGEVSYVDAQLGQLFEFLRESGLLDNTIIILTADHGEGLGDHGEKTHSYFAYNSTIHVPLILFAPDTPPQVVKENVCHIDIFPTVCELLDLSAPEHIQGESLVPLIKGKNRRQPSIYFESMSPYLNRGWAPLTGYIKGNMKYINLPIEEVYDLENDMEEMENLADKVDLAVFQKELSELKELLKNKEITERKETIDSQTLAKLRALGYVSAGSQVRKSSFTEKDDLKTLLPLQNKMMDAVASYRAGNTEEAIYLLKEVIAESPTFVMAYNNLATILQEIGRTKEALPILREGLKYNKNNVTLLSKLGFLMTETGQAKEAIPLLKKCTERENFNPEYWNYLGIAYYLSSQFKLAMDAYNQAISLDQDYALAYNNIGNIYLAVFLSKKDETAYILAIDNFKKAIKLDPKLASAYNGLGGAYKKAGKIEEAISLWKKALELEPSFSYPLYNLGLTYFELGDKEESLKYFKQYKNYYYEKLPMEEKKQIDRFIQECKKNEN